MEAAARLLVESTEADMRACQNALDTLLREQRQHRADPSVTQAPSLDHRVTEAEMALGKARGRVEMARALAALPADAGDEDIVELSEPYDAALHGDQPPAAAVSTALHSPSRGDAGAAGADVAQGAVETSKPAEQGDDAALFARLAELERAEEAAEAAAQGSAAGDPAEPLMPSTPAQQQQQQMGSAAAAASNPRLAQLGQLQQAGGSAHVVSDVSGVARADNSGSMGLAAAVQGVLQKQQLGGADERQAAGTQRQGETGSAASSPDDGGVSAVGNKLRRVSWADELGSGGAAGGPLAVAQNDSTTANKGLRRGFFDRRPAKPAVAPLPRTPAQKPGSRPAAPRSSIKQGSGVAAENSTDSARQPDAQRDPPLSFEQQQTAFTGVVGERSDGADMQPELLTDTPSTATPDKPLSKFRQRRMQA